MSNTSINVVVARQRPFNISNHGTGGVIDTTTPVTLKNVPTIAPSQIGMDSLNDINLSQRTDGSVPVYDQPTNTYIVKHVDFTEIDGDLDGGTF